MASYKNKNIMEPSKFINHSISYLLTTSFKNSVKKLVFEHSCDKIDEITRDDINKISEKIESGQNMVDNSTEMLTLKNDILYILIYVIKSALDHYYADRERQTVYIVCNKTHYFYQRICKFLKDVFKVKITEGCSKFEFEEFKIIFTKYDSRTFIGMNVNYLIIEDDSYGDTEKHNAIHKIIESEYPVISGRYIGGRVILVENKMESTAYQLLLNNALSYYGSEVGRSMNVDLENPNIVHCTSFLGTIDVSVEEIIKAYKEHLNK
jgi:hypothetical protein